MPSDRDQDPAAGRLRGCQCPGRDFKRSMRLSLPAAPSISKGPLQLENLWLRTAPGQPGCFPIPQSCCACSETVCAGINIPEIRHGNADREMDHTGDTRHYFDANDARALRQAEERFKELTSEGFTAAVRTTPGEVSRIRSIDRTAEETLFFPRLFGG
jgi:hypothetical protein